MPNWKPKLQKTMQWLNKHKSCSRPINHPLVLTLFLRANPMLSLTNNFRFYLSKLSLVVFVWMMLSCSGTTNNEIPTIQVPKKNDPDIPLIDLAKSVKTIQLETSENSLLSRVYDVKLFDEQLYVTDRKKILIFDREGNFIDQFGRRGEGPGEYRGISSFTLDSSNGNIYIASDYRVLVYTADSKLLMEKKFPHGTYNLEFVDGKLYKFLRSIGNEVKGGYANATSLLELSPQLDLLDSIPVKTVYLKENMVSRYPYMHFMSKNKTGTYLYYPVLTPENMLRDTIYQIEGNKLIPSIRLGFEKRQSLDEKGFKALQILNIINSSSYLICEYYQDRERRLFIFDKKESTGYNLKEGLLDDQGDPVVLRPLDMEKDMFFYIKTAEYTDGDTEEPNPLIGIVELK